MSGSPSAFQTDLAGYLLARLALVLHTCQSPPFTPTWPVEMTYVLKKFWEIEEQHMENSSLSPVERSVVERFKQRHYRAADGHFVVPLPKEPQSKPLGESYAQAVRRFLSLEKSLHSKELFAEFSMAMEEYFEKAHTGLVPIADLEKPTHAIFNLSMHAVPKESSIAQQRYVSYSMPRHCPPLVYHPKFTLLLPTLCSFFEYITYHSSPMLV